MFAISRFNAISGDMETATAFDELFNVLTPAQYNTRSSLSIGFVRFYRRQVYISTGFD